MELRKLLATLMVAALIMTSGCAGTLGDDLDTTSTEAPPTIDPSDYTYPGYADESGINTDGLTTAISNSLGDISSVTITESNTFQGSQSTSGREKIYKYNGERVSIEDYRSGSPDKFTYSGGANATTYAHSTNGTESRYFTSSTPTRINAFGTFNLRTYLGASEHNLEGITGMDGEPVAHYTLNDFNTVALQDVIFTENFGNVSGDVYVGSNGIIHEYSLSYEVGPNGEFTQTRTTSVSDINNTAVKQPDWLDTARDQAVTTDATFRNDGVVEVTITNGDTIPSESMAYAAVDSASANIELSSAIESGDTIYVYTQDNSVQISMTDPDIQTTRTRSLFLSIMTSSDLQVLEMDVTSEQ